MRSRSAAILLLTLARCSSASCSSSKIPYHQRTALTPRPPVIELARVFLCQPTCRTHDLIYTQAGGVPPPSLRDVLGHAAYGSHRSGESISYIIQQSIPHYYTGTGICIG